MLGFDVPLSAGGAAMPREDQFEDYVLRYVDSRVLRRYDRDENRILDPSEIEQVRWRDDWKQDDANHDGRLTRGELAARMARRWGRGRKAVTPPKIVPGASSGPSDRIRQHAASLLKKYDKNSNGKLERDEWRNMASFSRGADLNKDGIITRDELTRRLGSSGSGRPSSPRVGTSPPRSSRNAPPRRKRRSFLSRLAKKVGEDNKWKDRKSYRALSPAERLSKNIPEWFVEKDSNGDGQVAMAEYSTTWSGTELAEFKKYDVDRDGRITPAEAMPKEEKKE